MVFFFSFLSSFHLLNTIHCVFVVLCSKMAGFLTLQLKLYVGLTNKEIDSRNNRTLKKML